MVNPVTEVVADQVLLNNVFREEREISGKIVEKPRVFICYGREDREMASKLYNDLKSANITPWLDIENLLPGQIWEREITESIKRSQYFIVLLSKYSVNRTGFIQRELRLALDILDEIPESEIFLIPVRLDEETHFPDRLRHIQWVDLFPSWETGVNMIIRAIHRGSQP